jgi:arsenite methyltransferase
LKSDLESAGFKDVEVKVKEESRDVIAQWLPGSGAEDFVVSADVTARKK